MRANKRLAVALACSLALHALLFAVLPGGGTAKPGGRGKPLRVYLRADVVSPPLPVTEGGTSHNASLPKNGTDGRYLLPGEVDVRARPVKIPPLIYPEKAQVMRIAGVVRLRVYIAKNGKIDAVDVVAADPPGVFDEAALQALLSTSFMPAKKNGHAVDSQKLIEINFDPYEIAPSQLPGVDQDD